MLIRVLPALLAVFVLFGAFADRAEAIPAFARKYRTACTTCHVVFPKLNDFGDNFRRNGFRIPLDDEFFVKDAPVVMGAKAWKQVWPKALWPSDLPHLPPLSILTQFTLSVTEGRSPKKNIQVPDQFALLAAGTLGEDIGFFVHQGGGARYYATFSDILENWFGEDTFNLKFGLFEPDVVSLSNVRRVSATPTVLSTFTYDMTSGNANNFAFDRQVGFECFGVVKKRWRYTLGLVQGTGDSPDSNDHMDFYVRLNFKVGGAAFDGSDVGEGTESLKQTENWTDNSVTLGVIGYFGRGTQNDARVGGVSPYDVDTIRLGGDIRVNWKNLDLIAGFLSGEDQNADNDGVDIAYNLFYAQGDYMIFPWLMGYARYEDLQYRGPKSPQLLDDEVRRWLLGVTAALRANVRLSVEYAINNGGDKNNAFFLFFTFAF